MVILDPNRVWIDGCFDFSHHGHAAAVIQAKRTVPQAETCTLICGVHNDNDIEYHKGAKPVMHEQERYFHTQSLRAVDEIVRDAPYVTEPHLLDQHSCMYVVHGDDITTDADGNDCYQIMKDIGRFRVVRRTIGVSTTDIIQRILTGTGAPEETPLSEKASLLLLATGVDGFSPWCWVFEKSLESVIVEGGYQINATGCVYIEDAFDLFHAGHIDKFFQLRNIYPEKHIVAGVLKDEKDGSPTYMSYKERALSLLSCRYVDAIVINPGLEMSKVNFRAAVDINDKQLSRGNFGYLSKNTIIERVSSNKTSYTARNIKKGLPPPISHR